MRGAQTTRIIRLLLMLGARRTGMTIAEMREALNVSHRTVYRDLELLAELDVPLTTDREAGRTVYQLLDHDRWKLGVPLGLGEVVALHLGAELLEVQGGAAWQAAARSALKKLDAAVPGKLVARLGESLASVSVSTRGRRPYEARQEILEILTRAVAERRPVELVYATPGRARPRPRTVHPLVIRLEHGGAYLVAFDTGHQEVRTFLADRVHLASLGEGRFEPPEGFDVEGYFAGAFQVYRGGKAVKVRAEFAPRVAHLIDERRWHPSQRVRHLDDGALELTLEVQDTPELRAWLMGFGADVVVTAPQALARALEDEARRVAQAYAERRGREKRGARAAAKRKDLGAGDDR